MKRTRSLFVLGIGLGLLGIVLGPAPALAGPVFPMPAVPPHPPIGYVTHLAPIGPLNFPPGAVIGPVPYGDLLPSLLEPHHAEIELHNGSPQEVNFDVRITVPGGGVSFYGNITLPTASSVYFDVHYNDSPEIGPVGTWAMTATNAPGGPNLTYDFSVIEYLLPLFMPDSGPVFSPSGTAAPPVGETAQLVEINLAVVPEPASLVLMGCGVIALAWLRRRRS